MKLKLMQENLVYSGADDCHLKGWDIRIPCSPVLVNRKSHMAGVCCIQPSPTNEFEVGTGSYDDRARVFDVRNMQYPVEEVWRNRLRFGTTK
jgi:diphthine methyl ester acylhydrolase